MRTSVGASAGTPPRHTLRLHRTNASRKRLFRTRSLWDVLLDVTRKQAPAYREYSYAHHADVYALPLDPAAITKLIESASLAPRALTPQLAILPHISLAKFLCSR